MRFTSLALVLVVGCGTEAPALPLTASTATVPAVSLATTAAEPGAPAAPFPTEPVAPPAPVAAEPVAPAAAIAAQPSAPSTPLALEAPPGPTDPSVVVAARARDAPTIDGTLDDAAWTSATPIAIETDWRGTPHAPHATHVRLTWQPEALFVAFEGTFEGHVDAPDEPPGTEAEHLYAHDALEIFVDPGPDTPDTYFEIELGPRGHFLDVAVDRARRPRADVSWSSDLVVRTEVDEVAHTFSIEARIAATALGVGALAPADFRAGLFRIGTADGTRYFLARFPTMTERASFHVPERFGTLRLVE